jgi:ABC-type bacteriocin/lantibiotic exporter with double-glycine peptidase domain
MVLAYLGHDYTEEDLVRLLRTRSFGTPADNIRLLGQLDCSVILEQGTEADLHRHLARGLPCVIFLKTEVLPHWQIEDAHAVVLVGMADETVYINDPAFDGAPVSVPLQNFLLAWSEFDYEYAVIEPL